MDNSNLNTLIINHLTENKATEIKQLDVREMTGVTDTLIICTANSSRHAKSLAEKTTEHCKKNNFTPLGVEGKEEAEWILIDMADTVVHIMTAQAREHYNLEKLWGIIETQRQINE